MSSMSLNARSKRARCSLNNGGLGVVGGREVRVHGGEVEVLAREQPGQRAPHVVEAEPEAVHPGVNLEVIPDAPPVSLGRGLHGVRGAGRRDRRRQVAVEQSIEIADAQRSEHENLRADAGGAQRRALFDVRTRQQVRARLLERERDLARAVPVRVRLDDGDDARRGGRSAAPVRGTRRCAVVGLQRGEVNAGDRGSDHASARSYRSVAKVRAALVEEPDRHHLHQMLKVVVIEVPVQIETALLHAGGRERERDARDHPSRRRLAGEASAPRGAAAATHSIARPYSTITFTNASCRSIHAA